MSRPLRIEYPGAYYHVMNRGLAYQPIFKADEDREKFLDGLGEVHSRWNARIFCYCLMGNHYHLGVQTPGEPLSRIMRHIDGVYTQRYNRRHRRDGPLFRGRYRAILVDGDQYLLAVARYIHHNPVEAGMVERAEGYGWSSLRHYLRKRGRPNWLDTQIVMDHFGGSKPRMLEFMHSKMEPEVRAHYGSGQIGPILGSEAFKEWVKAQGWKSRGDREIPERRHLALGMDTCIGAVARVYRMRREAVTRRARGVKNEARQVGMYICREAGGYSHKQIAESFGAGSYSTVSSVCVAVKKRMGNDKVLGRQIRRVYARLGGNFGQQAT